MKKTVSIAVLGSGCAKCRQLKSRVSGALDDLGLDFPVEHITDFARIAGYGVMSTPALAINGVVVSAGKLLRKEEVRAYLERALGESV